MSKASLSHAKQYSFLCTLLGLFFLLGTFYGILSILRTPEEGLQNSTTVDQGDSTRHSFRKSSVFQDSGELGRSLKEEPVPKSSTPPPNDPNAVDVLFQRALMAVREKSNQEAGRDLLQEVLRRDPNHIAAAEELYASFERSGDLEGALAALQKLEMETSSPEHGGIAYSQGRLYLDLGHPDVARSHLEQALQSGADHPMIRDQLATAYIYLGEKELAQREWQILAHDETAGRASWNAKARLAELLFLEGRQAEAESYAKEILQQDPQHQLGNLFSGR